MPESTTPKCIDLLRITLEPKHRPTGNTKHYLVDSEERREFPPFFSFSISQVEGDSGFYLFYHSEQGVATDTWHISLDDAIHQAEFEFGVTREEWQQCGTDR